MNTIICMQSSMISRLVRKVDEHLSAQDIPPDMQTRCQFLTMVCTVDFTTINSVRNVLGNDAELLDAYFDFTLAILDHWEKPPSVYSIEVISLDGANAKLAMESF